MKRKNVTPMYRMPTSASETFTIFATQLQRLIFVLRLLAMTGVCLAATKAQTVTSGVVYKLRNQCSQKLLDVSGASVADSTPLIQWTEHNGLNQQFKIEETNSSYYRLTAQHSQKVVDVRGGNTGDGTTVQQYASNGTNAQQWKLIDVGGGYYKLESRVQAGKVLDVSGASTADGARVQLWTDNGTCAQKWKFEQIGATPPPPASWRERILNPDGTINWSEYDSVANNYNRADMIDYRFGPRYEYYNQTPENIPNLWGRTNSNGYFGADESCLRANPKCDIEWFAMSGNLLFSPEASAAAPYQAGVARANAGNMWGTNIAPYYTIDMGVRWERDAHSPYYLANPDPATQMPSWIDASGGNLPAPPVATVRTRSASGVTGFLLYKNGLIGVTGTGNDGYSGTMGGGLPYAFAKLPAGKVPTGGAVTPNNEFLLVTVWDTINHKGEVAVIALKGRVLAQETKWLYGLHSWPNVSALKLLGFVELPFAAPSSISTASDHVQGSGRGSGDNANMNLDQQSERDLWYNGMFSPAPGLGVGPNDFSVRWTGQVQPEYSETYTFATHSDDGVRLWINGQLLIDNWTTHGATWDTANVTLEAGRKYDIKLEYFQGNGDATVQLRWSSPSVPWQIIPQNRLFAAPSDNAATGLKGEYFAGTNLSDLKLTRVDSTVEFIKSPFKRAAQAGYAMVASRAENKIAFVDLQPLYQYYRQMYFTTQERFNQTKNEGGADNQWPYAFAYAPEQTPLVTQTIAVQQPTAVAAGMPWYTFLWRNGGESTFGENAYIASLDGTVRMYKIGDLMTTASNTTTIGSSFKSFTVGRNPTAIEYGGPAGYGNDLFIVSRGAKSISYVYWDGTVKRTMRDGRLVDPVNVTASNNGRCTEYGCFGVAMLTVMDFTGKKVVSYRYNPEDPNPSTIPIGNPAAGSALFEYGFTTLLPGFPFMYTLAEVI